MRASVPLVKREHRVVGFVGQLTKGFLHGPADLGLIGIEDGFPLADSGFGRNVIHAAELDIRIGPYVLHPLGLAGGLSREVAEPWCASCPPSTLACESMATHRV